jgi:very-short-patch-repair endonuclease
MRQKSPIEARTSHYYLKYINKLKTESQKHRKGATNGESIFWKEILSKDKTGYRFLRQKPIGRFILDFYCSKLLLDIEIDGSSHSNKQDYDNERDKYLEQRGIKTIRYNNTEVVNNIEIIKNKIRGIINDREAELEIRY